MKLSKVLLILSFWILLVTNGVEASASGTTDGLTCAGAGDSADERIAACTRAIASGKLSIQELAVSYYNRGNAWRNKGDYDKAIADCTDAIKRNPRYAAAYYDRGLAWQNEGDYDRAIADHNEAIRLDPRYVDAYFNRGIAWQNKGNHDKAIADCTEAIRLNPRLPLVYYIRGMAWTSKGDYDKAIADCSDAIRLDPQFALAYYRRGIAFFYKGEFSSAATSLAQAQRLQPDTYAAVWLYLARARSNGDGKAELVWNTTGLDRDEWPAPVVALYLDKTDSKAVISQATRANEYEEQLCEANFYVGQWYLLGKEKQQARTYFSRAQRDCPKHLQEYAGSVSELQRLK